VETELLEEMVFRRVVGKYPGETFKKDDGDQIGDNETQKEPHRCPCHAAPRGGARSNWCAIGHGHQRATAIENDNNEGDECPSVEVKTKDGGAVTGITLRCDVEKNLSR